MKILLGDTWLPTIDGTSVTITRAMSDPVPTCTILVRDNTSSIQPIAMQELVVIDDVAIPNPTRNLLSDPAITTLFTTVSWITTNSTGITIAQASPAGATITLSNAPSGTHPGVLVHQPTWVQPGQTYVFSFFVQGSSTPTNMGAYAEMHFLDNVGNVLSNITLSGTVPVSTTLTRLSVSGVAPTGCHRVDVHIGVNCTSSTNSGVMTVTQAQCEPQWFPTLSYPTPFCGPNQPNVTFQQFETVYIRQARKFAGFVTHATAQDYHGNARTLQIDAVGYAWLLGTIIVNASYTNMADSDIITNLLNTYFQPFTPFNLFGYVPVNTDNVISGITLSNFGSNWDDIRTLIDTLASTSAFYWTIDAYWNMIYAPPGYVTMPISLICDQSKTPDNVTTFPAYNFSAEMDYTQPGSNILVIGSGANVAQVVDTWSPIQVGDASRYYFQAVANTPAPVFMRKVNDSTLQSVTDCTNRGMAELLQYDYSRHIYHLTTNQELIPGEGIAVTSNTDGLNATVLLIQQVTATWLGTSELRADVWEYAADLGATNRHATSILSRLFRIANKNTSAPAISATTLAVVESVAVNDTIDSNSLYAETVLADSPLAYYRLGEPAGFGITTAYDWAGSAFNGTYVGGFTLSQPGAIFNDTNTAVLFDGSTGWTNLVTGVNGNGLGTLSVELWAKLSTTALGSFSAMIMSGNSDGYALVWGGTTAIEWTVMGISAVFNTSPIAGAWLHIVGTYDGATLRLYVNGTQRATHALTGTVTATNTPVIAASIGHSLAYPGTIDEVAIYSTALSAARIQAHYNVGTLGHA